MGIDHRFFLHHGSESLEIEEPSGFAGIELSLKRDDKMHGMTFDASTSSLQFYGEARDFLKEQKRLYGLNSNVVFQALSHCDDTTPEAEILRGKLNFGKFKEECGDKCLVSLPVESETCEVTLKNRFDQKVDIDLGTSADQFTTLPAYAGLGLSRQLIAKHLFASVSGEVDETDLEIEIDEFFLTEVTTIVRPTYSKERYNSIDTAVFTPTYNFESTGNAFATPISPQFLLDDIIACFNEDLQYRFVLKGSYSLSAAGIGSFLMDHGSVKLVTWGGVGNIFDDSTVIQEVEIIPALTDVPDDGSTLDGTFNVTFTGTMVPVEGLGVYAFLEFSVVNVGGTGSGVHFYADITFDPVFTEFEITANKACPPTSVDLYLVHETLSRATESITDYCMRVKSEYYGRTDSQPFAFDQDGCGGLRFLTSGLKIRKAPEDKFFVSLKELIEGLQAIDNIGMGVEADELRPGQFVLRIEELDFFYNNDEILYHDAIPKVDEEVDEQKYYSMIFVGYKKWEVGRINGLDEFNSNREFKTSLSSVNNTLDITSNLVAGGYPIEVTRQQSFAESGGADTTYDNETFIITGTRDAYGIEPEQGNITDPENIYSPSTTYNFRISPLHNLLRWYKSIVNSYANVADSINKLLFSSGTGNLIAKGMVTPGTYDSSCILENQVIQENQHLFTSHFQRAADYTPLYRNETVTYEYPMSIGDYRKVKANPYGYISYQCGNGDFQKGYIKEIKYRPAGQNGGMATFILKKKWE